MSEGRYSSSSTSTKRFRETIETIPSPEVELAGRRPKPYVRPFDLRSFNPPALSHELATATATLGTCVRACILHFRHAHSFHTIGCCPRNRYKDIK